MEDATLLGTVQDVSGSTVSVSLESQTVSGLAFISGHGYRLGQVGSFVRIPMGYIDLFGIVSQVGAGAAPARLAEITPHGYRWMTVQLLGEGQRGRDFQRGISQYPTVGDQVHLVTELDLERIYGHADLPQFVTVGTLASAESVPALIDLNKLVTRHSAIVGATGAGKSTTVASLLRSLSDPSRYPSARILVVDIHGEYAPAVRDRAMIFRIGVTNCEGQRPLFIPYWALTFDEFITVAFGNLDDGSRAAVLEEITELKQKSLLATPRDGITGDTLTVDSPVPFSVHQLWFHFHKAMHATHTVPSGGQTEQTEALLEDNLGQPVQRGDAMRVIPPRYKPNTQAAGATKIYLSQPPYSFRRQLDHLRSRLRDPRFDFLFKPGDWSPDLTGNINKDLDVLLKEWIGGPHRISILDLSGVPISVLNGLVGALLRIVYDSLFWARNTSEGGRKRPLLVVLEEAHAYLGREDAGAAAVAVKRIVKEGRKYGVGAMVVSQRPAEIDPTILSQCGTIISMRLSNTADRSHITGAVTDNLEGLLSMLPVLRTGEAIIVGEAVRLPVRTLISAPPPDMRPDSVDPLVFDPNAESGWNRKPIEASYADIVTIWRKQDADYKPGGQGG
jgi:Helicase HerA, central domain